MRPESLLVAIALALTACAESSNAQCAADHGRGTAEYRACLDAVNDEVRSRFPRAGKGGHR